MPMPMEQLHFFRRLRERLSALNSGGEKLVDSCTVPSTSLSIPDASTAVTGSPGGSRANAYSVSYSALMTRKTILMHLQLLLSSRVMIEDVKFAYGECRKICEAVNNFNVNHSGMCKPTYQGRRSLQCLHAKQYLSANGVFNKILYGDIIEVFIDARSRVVSEELIKDCSAETALRLAEFENSLIMAFVGIITTFTNTLDTQNSCQINCLSDEMYPSVSSESNMSWTNVVLTGERAARLRPLWKRLFCKVWSKVANNLSRHGGSLLHGGHKLNKFQSSLAKASCHIGFEFHPEVQSCLRQVASFLLAQSNLQKWDKTFQEVMVANHSLQNRGYREVILPISNGQVFLESEIYENVHKDFSEKIEVVDANLDKPSSILLHIEILKQTSTLCLFIQIVLSHLSLELQQCVRRKLFLWDLPSLAWLLTCGVPQLLASAKKCVSIIQFVSCPRLAFPTYSTLQRIGKCNQGVNEELYYRLACLQETGGDFYTVFYEQWQQRCSRIIQSHFPPAKQFKKAGRRTTTSQYCDQIIEVLLSPLVEAIQKLPEETHQKNFAYLLLTIFYNTFRRAITSTNKAYLAPHIAEQLLRDIDYLQRWIGSSERGLNPSVCSLICNLPIVSEMKSGLQEIIGKPCDETDGSIFETEHLIDMSSSFHHVFPIFRDISWNSAKDWRKQ